MASSDSSRPAARCPFAVCDAFLAGGARDHDDASQATAYPRIGADLMFLLDAALEAWRRDQPDIAALLDDVWVQQARNVLDRMADGSGGFAHLVRTFRGDTSWHSRHTLLPIIAALIWFAADYPVSILRGTSDKGIALTLSVARRSARRLYVTSYGSEGANGPVSSAALRSLRHLRSLHLDLGAEGRLYSMITALTEGEHPIQLRELAVTHTRDFADPPPGVSLRLPGSLAALTVAECSAALLASMADAAGRCCTRLESLTLGHVTGDFRSDPLRVASSLADLMRALAAAGAPLRTVTLENAALTPEAAAALGGSPSLRDLSLKNVSWHQTPSCPRSLGRQLALRLEALSLLGSPAEFTGPLLLGMAEATGPASLLRSFMIAPYAVDAGQSPWYEAHPYQAHARPPQPLDEIEALLRAAPPRLESVSCIVAHLTPEQAVRLLQAAAQTGRSLASLEISSAAVGPTGPLLSNEFSADLGGVSQELHPAVRPCLARMPKLHRLVLRKLCVDTDPFGNTLYYSDLAIHELVRAALDCCPVLRVLDMGVLGPGDPRPVNSLIGTLMPRTTVVIRAAERARQQETSRGAAWRVVRAGLAASQERALREGGHRSRLGAAAAGPSALPLARLPPRALCEITNFMARETVPVLFA